jgi:hypothetical protein
MASSNDERYQRAKRRVEAERGFYIHALIYMVVNAGLFLINMVSGGGVWFYWPLIGWGIGLAAHGLSVFVFAGVFGAAWEERRIRQLLKDDRPQENGPGGGSQP